MSKCFLCSFTNYNLLVMLLLVVVVMVVVVMTTLLHLIILLHSWINADKSRRTSDKQIYVVYMLENQRVNVEAITVNKGSPRVETLDLQRGYVLTNASLGDFVVRTSYSVLTQTSIVYILIWSITLCYIKYTSITVNKHNNFLSIRLLFNRLGYMFRLNIKPSSGP
jgi:hypothetical protein